MAQAVVGTDSQPRQISFQGAVQTLAEFAPLLRNAAAEELPQLCLSGQADSLTTALTEAVLTENPTVLLNVFASWQLFRYRASEEYASRLLGDLVAGLPRVALDFVLPPHRDGGAFHVNGILSKWRRECLG